MFKDQTFRKIFKGFTACEYLIPVCYRENLINGFVDSCFLAILEIMAECFAFSLLLVVRHVIFLYTKFSQAKGWFGYPFLLVG